MSAPGCVTARSSRSSNVRTAELGFARVDCVEPGAILCPWAMRAAEAVTRRALRRWMRTDRANLESIERAGVPPELWYPTDAFPEGVNTRQPIAAGITSVDKAYTTRALWMMAYLWQKAQEFPDPLIRSKLQFTLTSLYQRVTLFSEFRFWGGSGNTANFNVPAIINEQNVIAAFERKAKTIAWYLREERPDLPQAQVSTQSACHLTQLSDKSVDYIFTDPPFGGNINYSEMNFLWESWLRTHTDCTEEAVCSCSCSVSGRVARDDSLMPDFLGSGDSAGVRDGAQFVPVAGSSSLQPALSNADNLKRQCNNSDFQLRCFGKPFSRNSQLWFPISDF